jgi:hypothetical protein
MPAKEIRKEERMKQRGRWNIYIYVYNLVVT